MEQTLIRMMDAKSDPLTSLKELIDALRPGKVIDGVTAINNARALCYLLEQHPEYRAALRKQLFTLLGSTRQVQLYTDTGILSNESVFTAIVRRVGSKLLPPPVKPEYLKDLFGVLFPNTNDYVWLNEIPTEVWFEVGAAAHLEELSLAEIPTHIRLQQLEAIQVLSCRLSAIGLEPEIVLHHPDVERFESPFVRLNAEVLSYIERYREDLTARRPPDEDHSHILVLLQQCEQIIAKVWKMAAKNGASVSLTYHLLRLKQHIDRLKVLFDLVDSMAPAKHGPALLGLFLELVKAENRKYSVRDVLQENTELLALQITEHASHTGEHYISETRSEWLQMFRSAAGAGAIIGCMALIKILFAKAHLPPLLEAFAFSMNYALGFMLIHILHFTVATKQPAMTAARIAAALPTIENKKNEAYTELIELIIKVIRTQFIAIIGNVLLAIPVALGIAWLWWYEFGQHVVDTTKADKMLQELMPIAGLGIFYAAIAGCCLFLAGLISGYYDNKSLYNQIPQRIAAMPLLNKILGEYRSRRLGQYIEHNLGALAGNFYFGIMLGSMATLGFLLGLPLDIRHITFSAANLAYAVSAYNFTLAWPIVAWGAMGVAVIGITNLFVSFTLALWVAMRSRKRRMSELKPLWGKFWRRAMSRPIDLFIAPKSASESTKLVTDAAKTASTEEKAK
ncbi:site-specific recombinase [uncultured Deefgea sp.]|uniref:site-specific recombinase n=1 Tax=uncultured Deefgea sp. TaxID=1304914 RepID=UPI0026324B5B|nr:site-specific recombinase [uncultured Deefgea sp.]